MKSGVRYGQIVSRMLVNGGCQIMSLWFYMSTKLIGDLCLCGCLNVGLNILGTLILFVSNGGLLTYKGGAVIFCAKSLN